MSNEFKLGTFTGHPFQVINIQPNDVILLRISDDLRLHECSQLLTEMKKEFPNNTVLLTNEHILKGITILRSPKEIDINTQINEGIDIDKFLNEIMKGNSNDFLH